MYLSSTQVHKFEGKKKDCRRITIDFVCVRARASAKDISDYRSSRLILSRLVCQARARARACGIRDTP